MSQTAQQIRPKLVVTGADAAVAFYSEALGAVPGRRFEHDGRVAFADLIVLGTTLTLKDADEYDPAPGDSGAPGPILDAVVDDPDAVAASMIAAGAELLIEVADRPYGARAGRVRDPFGVQWIISTPLPG